MVDKLEAGERARRDAMRHHEQMLDAEKLCVPCKLCGGAAKISDAGAGAGYYIKCSGTTNWRASTGCMIDMRRLGGWAYNVMDWWNRLHAATPANGEQVERDAIALLREIVAGDGAFFSAPYTIKAEAILARHDAGATPTEDARSRVKVLEEALGWLAECDNLIVAASKTSDDCEVRRASGQLRGTGPTPIAAIIDARNTALGNKETDRHG